MTVHSKPEENIPPGTAGSRTGRVRQLPQQVLRNWPRPRVAAAVVAAGLAATFLLAANGMMAGAGTGWTGYALVGAGSILAGVLAGSYVNAPIGAAATLCDLRWPALGLFGAVWSSSAREALPAAQIAVGILSLSVMAWALHGRLELERKVTLGRSGSPDDDVDVCTDCRPLFHAKPRQD
ncbi:hypothetical protein [Arthrobacter sp. AL12]|uniref:hypothetical protein n=1 Tax=Arthrobacter sp. AL12 TaxID=3042241 RepID=UPI00249AC900|nr:hypothetical protein [Arthrobacter sp. AL12]MDI3210865.1 hypothetical protein [Arthrobacter sp. AL12]